MSLTILFGTETGTAEYLADDLADHHGDATATPMAGKTPLVFSEASFLVLVTSTYGEGELPTSSRPLHEALLAERPDLSALRFCVFSLGDRKNYPDTFANSGTLWAETLEQLGARRIGVIGHHDASSSDMPEDIAKPWLDSVLAEAELA